MADDQEEILGKWSVAFRGWIWEYDFSAGRKVTWRDPLNNESGSGRWVKTGKLVNIVWDQSATRESWYCPIKADGQKGWYAASYGVGEFKARKLSTPQVPLSDLIPVNPIIADLPWSQYVDAFAECKYDMNFKIPSDKSFAYSSLLQLKYDDGMYLELDIGGEFSDRKFSSVEARNVIAGGNVGRNGRIFPAVMAEATVPRLWKERAEAYKLQNEDADVFAATAMAGVAFVLSVPAMPAGMPPPAGITVTRRRVPGVPALSRTRIRPVNGTVNAGGGLEQGAKDCTNLNPIKPGSGGPSRGIPNHVQAGFEEIGNTFEAGSVKRVISNRLRFGDVRWNEAAKGSARVMAPGGKIGLNVWTQSQQEVDIVVKAFKDAGFRDVAAGGAGAGTFITGAWP